MPDQREAIDSFTETLGFDHGSTLSDNVHSSSDISSDYISLNVTNENDPNEDIMNAERSEPPSFSDPFELDDHRAVSHKRKAVDLSTGQSSSGIGSSNMFESLDPTIPRLRLSENPIAENTRRNVSLGIRSSSHQELLPANIINNNDNLSSNPVLQIPVLRRNLQSTSRWTRSSASRTNRSPNLESFSDQYLFAPPNGGQTELDWSPNGGGSEAVNDGGSGGSATSGAGTSSGLAHNYHPRIISAFLRRSLLSASNLETDGGQNSLLPRIPSVLRTSPSSSSQDIGIPAVGNHSRSSLLVARQLEGGVAFYPSRTMTGGIERRGRLVSEIRSVLDSMRRGDAIQFEDLMLLDQSVFYGIADNHDRHRDMRLDIDNMSYEELLALEDRIGNVNTGLTEEKILKNLKQTQYVIKTGQQDAEPCCICQEEYKNGDDLGILQCGHDFHQACIKQWLQLKNSCPSCKSTAFAAAT